MVEVWMLPQGERDKNLTTAGTAEVTLEVTTVGNRTIKKWSAGAKG